MAGAILPLNINRALPLERGCGMSLIPHFTMLGLATVLSSSVPQHHVDLKMPSPDGVQRLDQLWLVTYIDEANREIVAQAKLANGGYAPLIAADVARLESMMPAARGLAKAGQPPISQTGPDGVQGEQRPGCLVLNALRSLYRHAFEAAPSSFDLSVSGTLASCPLLSGRCAVFRDIEAHDGAGNAVKDAGLLTGNGFG
jgi:hypothetical protein